MQSVKMKEFFYHPNYEVLRDFTVLVKVIDNEWEREKYLCGSITLGVVKSFVDLYRFGYTTDINVIRRRVEGSLVKEYEDLISNEDNLEYPARELCYILKNRMKKIFK